MFKKKNQATEKAPAKAKGKSKKSSGGSSNGGFKKFLLMHSEKVVLGLIAAVSAFLIFDGLNVKSFPDQNTPEELTKISSQAESAILQDHWAAIEPERRVTDSFSSLVERSSRPSDPKFYPSPEWERKPDSGGQKRMDPKLLAPIEIEGQSIYGTLATTVSQKVADPFKEMKPAPPLIKRPAGSTGMAGGEGAMAGMSDGGAGMPGTGMPGDMGMGMGGTGTEPIRYLQPKYDRGFASGMQGGSGMGMEGGGMDMGMPGGAMSGMPGGATGMPGGMPGGMAGTGTPGTGMTPMGEKRYQVAQSVLFNAVNALVPYEDQLNEYSIALQNSSIYDPMRDQPWYLGFEVQRADVSNNPHRKVEDAEWKQLDRKSLKITHEGFPTSWLTLAGSPAFCPEVVQPMYTHPKLSLSIPPIMMRDYRKFARHSKTPTVFEAYQFPQFKRGTGEGNDEFVDLSKMSAMNGMGGMGMPGMGSEGGAMMGMPGGMGMPGMGSEGGAMMGMPGGMGMPGMGSEGGAMMGMPGGMGMPGDGMSGMPGMGGDMGGMGGYQMVKSKYKLVRFFDFDVVQGRTYRYRVRLLMEDPNYPPNFRMTPPLPTLDQEALRRVQDLQNADKKVNDKILAEWMTPDGKLKDLKDKNGKPLPRPKLAKSSTRQSDWSEPSKPIRVAYPGMLAVGSKASLPTMNQVKVNNTVVSYEADPTARVALSIASWDGKRGVDVFRHDIAERGKTIFGKYTGQMGSIKNLATLVQPFLRKILQDPDFYFNDRINLVDIKPQEPLGLHNNSKDPLFTPLEVVTIDVQTGELRYSNEFTDLDTYRMISFADETEMAEKANAQAKASGGTGNRRGAGAGAGAEGT